MKTVKVSISRRMLEHLLDLPEGIEIRSTAYDFNSACVLVRLHGDHLPDIPVEEGVEITDSWVLPEKRFGNCQKLYWPTLEKK